jgi:hypothetical protein
MKSGVRSEVSGLRLLRQRKTFAVNFFENNIATSTEKGFTDFLSQTHRVVAYSGFPQDLGSIGMSYQPVQTNAAVYGFGEGSDGNLAAAAEFVEQGALASGSGARGRIIEKSQQWRVALSPFEFRFPRRPGRRRGS